MYLPLVQHVIAVTAVDGVYVSLVQYVSALITVDVCICVYGGNCQCFSHCGWGCLCFWCYMLDLLPLLVGVSVSLVQNVSALTTVDGCVCVSVGTYQCCCHCILVY